MDDSWRGRLQPYMGALKVVSATATLMLAGVGGAYWLLSWHIDRNWPVAPEITRRATRRLLRGAAMREHVAPDARIAYMFLLAALEQIHADGELDEGAPAVQEIVVRLADAASRIGEAAPARRMLEDAWRRVVDDDGLLRGAGDRWVQLHACRIADVLGPLQLKAGDPRAAKHTLAAALRAAKQVLDAPDAPAAAREEMLLRHANYLTSLGEALALLGDLDSSQALLSSVLGELRARAPSSPSSSSPPPSSSQPRRADRWTCLDAIVMLDLSQVAQRRGAADDARRWAAAGLAATAEWPKVHACQLCRAHLLPHLAALAERAGDPRDARGLYAAAIAHAEATGLGDADHARQAMSRIDAKLDK
ncbi:hypothetical protein H4R18_005646 [Coemansia javaensis]|uniref:Uncharacterized protein n=1 Tax=Coemansia javaensis TaxID=2761396 RepID=A0A9W8LDZ5_9FUNG|nr:hypothetical protein H4R18_005646 [Coemansia javaensis]